MSKRFYYPQQQGDRKKAKLDISISDHNFPLSQKPTENDNWGDDNDDEILLMVSQACEEAYNNNDNSQLPNYSICMQPGTTSTQLNPQPSTSKTNSTFKKPSFNSPIAVSTHLRETFTRISSPLPRITSKVTSKTNGVVALNEDLFNDKVFKSQDAEYVYKQLLQLQEENTKLKSENGKLLEKCVTKEGEASILRTQLKSCQTAIDNVRLDKIKAQEKVQMEMNEKLVVSNNQIHDLKTQLDFKSLEIISVKEKYKKLLSKHAVDIDISQRPSNNFIKNETPISLNRRTKTLTGSVQTDDKVHLLKLNKTCRLDSSNLNIILPHILEPSANQQYSILDYNDKLQNTRDLSQNKCQIYSTFHRIPRTPVPKESKRKVVMSVLFEDLTAVASGSSERMEERYYNIFNSIALILVETQAKLEMVCQRVTASFQKEMDEKYIEVTSSNYPAVSRHDLLKSRALYKEEQDILSRKMLATLSYILETSRGLEWFHKYNSAKGDVFINHISRICVLLDNASCAILYSGLLLSITTFISTLMSSKYWSKVNDVVKTILSSRAMPFVLTNVLSIVKDLSADDKFVSLYCPGNGTGNLKIDYDQGVLLYRRDSCYLQLLLKQIETCLKCIEKQKIMDKAIDIARSLIILYNNISDNESLTRQKSRCDCQLVLVQVIVYSLRICADMLDINNYLDYNLPSYKQDELLSVCRCGIQMLCQCALRDVELSTQLSHNEGHLIEFCERIRHVPHNETYTNMLSELTGTLQSSPEDMPPSFHKQSWLQSFNSFSLVD